MKPMSERVCSDATPCVRPIGQLQQFLVITFLVTGLWYLAWRATTFNPDAPLFSWLVYGAEIFGFMTAVFHVFMTWNLTERRAPAPQSGLKVDVFIPTYNESIEVVRRTLLAATAMDYPHQTFLLDDGHRPEMEELARSLGCVYLARPDRDHAKAGNLNYGLKHSQADFVAIFDADHAPHRSFLLKTLGFFRDDKVAFVQTPQDFYNLDSYQHRSSKRSRVVWTEQALFFRVIQRGKDFWNAAFFCGSCAVVRRNALDKIGGFATETITEDLHTSIRLHMQGYRSVYIPESLAFGIAPATIGQFLHQRLRWGQGAMQVWKKEGLLLNKGLTLAQRLNYFASIVTYFEGWQKAIFYAAPVVVLTTGLMPILANGHDFLWHFVPYFFLSFWVFEELGRGYGHIVLTEQYNLARFATFVAATLGLVRKDLRFVVTSKGREKTRREQMMPHTVVLAANALAIPTGLLLYAMYHPVPLDGFVASEIWAVINVLMAISFFAFTRQSSQHKRGEYRFPVPIPAQLRFQNGVVEDVTVDDLSTAGFRFYGRFPTDLEVGSQAKGKLFLPSGPLNFTATIRSRHAGSYRNDAGMVTTYVKSVGCQFESLAETDQARLERFLFGSDLQWRVNGLADRRRTPLEWLQWRRNKSRVTVLGQRTWTACELNNSPLRAAISNADGRGRWLLVPGVTELGNEVMLRIHSRTASLRATASVGDVEVIETAESPLYLVELNNYREEAAWETTATAKTLGVAMPELAETHI